MARKRKAQEPAGSFEKPVPAGTESAVDGGARGGVAVARVAADVGSGSKRRRRNKKTRAKALNGPAMTPEMREVGNPEPMPAQEESIGPAAIASLMDEGRILREKLDSWTQKISDTFKRTCYYLASNSNSAVVLQCAICTETVAGAQTTHCGHTFCMTCLRAWFTDCRRNGRRHANCPVCRRTVDRQPVPNFAINHVIERLQDILGIVSEVRDLGVNNEAGIEDPWAGLFHRALGTGTMVDEDNVIRCVYDGWEIVNGECVRCGVHVGEGLTRDSESTDNGVTSSEDDADSDGSFHSSRSSSPVSIVRTTEQPAGTTITFCPGHGGNYEQGRCTHCGLAPLLDDIRVSLWPVGLNNERRRRQAADTDEDDESGEDLLHEHEMDQEETTSMEDDASEADSFVVDDDVVERLTDASEDAPTSSDDSEDDDFGKAPSRRLHQRRLQEVSPVRTPRKNRHAVIESSSEDEDAGVMPQQASSNQPSPEPGLEPDVVSNAVKTKRKRSRK